MQNRASSGLICSKLRMPGSLLLETRRYARASKCSYSKIKPISSRIVIGSSFDGKHPATKLSIRAAVVIEKHYLLSGVEVGAICSRSIFPSCSIEIDTENQWITPGYQLISSNRVVRDAGVWILIVGRDSQERFIQEDTQYSQQGIWSVFILFARVETLTSVVRRLRDATNSENQADTFRQYPSRVQEQEEIFSSDRRAADQGTSRLRDEATS